MDSNDAATGPPGGGPAPRYLQVADRIRRDVGAGRFAPGDRLPPEETLARALGVSRGTLRQALGALGRAGLVQTIPGRGTFVRGAAPAAAPPAEGRGRVLGMVIPSVARTRIPDLIAGAEAELRAAGYALVLAGSGDDSAEEARQVRRLVADGAVGLLVYPVDGSTNAPLFRELAAHGPPLVLIDRYLLGLTADAVVADNIGGAYAAVSRLIEVGRERVGLVSTRNLGTSSIAERQAGYWWAMQQHGRAVEPRLVCADLERVFSWPAPESAEAGHNRQIVRAYLAAEPRPDALFAVTDTVAFQVLEVATALGLRVPEDLAIVGFDNLAYPDYGGVPLTTVDQPRDQIGATAARLVLQRLRGHREQPARIVLATRLIVRGTCGGETQRMTPARCELDRAGTRVV